MKIKSILIILTTVWIKLKAMFLSKTTDRIINYAIINNHTLNSY